LTSSARISKKKKKSVIATQYYLTQVGFSICENRKFYVGSNSGLLLSTVAMAICFTLHHYSYVTIEIVPIAFVTLSPLPPLPPPPPPYCPYFVSK